MYLPVFILLPKAYLGPCQTSKMEIFFFFTKYFCQKLRPRCLTVLVCTYVSCNRIPSWLSKNHLRCKTQDHKKCENKNYCVNSYFNKSLLRRSGCSGLRWYNKRSFIMDKLLLFLQRALNIKITTNTLVLLKHSHKKRE